MQTGTSTLFFLKQIFSRIARKQFSLTSAGLAYYFLMSLFPALVLLTTLSSYLPLRNAVDHSLGFIHYVMPEQSESMIRDMVRRIGTRRPGLLSVGFATTVWLASTAVKGVILSLDRAYRVVHSRSRSVTRLLSLCLTLLIGILFLLAVLATAAGPPNEAFRLYTKWVISAIFIFVTLELLYIVAPNAPLSQRLTAPGATVATAIWLLISWALGFYFRHYAQLQLGVLFGLLATPLAFMAWLYWSAAAVLIGGEINFGLAQARRLTSGRVMSPGA
jgi:membrane protein